ncbi:hypothetical protein [Nostoc sp. MG11]|uniref:hypothetical protein n=1 Tax=Nostoc sp. MG11 TaxID=2721166 RepID=UPI001866EDE7|nr:hypothetical protein [Nostoc sp. MG11]
MKTSTSNSMNGGGNPSSGGNLPSRSPFESLDFLGGTGNTSGTNSSNIPGGGINPFAGDAGSKLQQLVSNRLKLVLGEDFFKNTNKAFASGGNPPISGGGSNPFAGAGSLPQRSPFEPLREVIGDNIPFSGNNSNTGSSGKPVANAGSPPFNASNAPVGNGNRNFGSGNATIGNFNSNYGSDSATIGNGNWNFNKNNATIGNGNWLFGKDNATLGNGNWYWDDGSNNATLGNGNWQFGSDNATIGNGNWDFGDNNTVIGNGNWIFTSGNKIVGNGNWIVDDDNTTIAGLESFPQGVRDDVDNLINSLIGRIGKDFVGLTGNLEVSDAQTFNRLILSKGTNINGGNISTDIKRLLASLNPNQGNTIYQPGHNSQPVPEPTFSASLIVAGLLYLLLSKFKKRSLKIQ